MKLRPARVAGTSIVRFDAAAVCDGTGLIAAPGSVLVEVGPDAGGPGWPLRVLAVGQAAQVATHEPCRAPRLRVVNRPQAVLLPGLVNAHTHLDLTHIGPRSHQPQDGFGGFARTVMAERHSDPEAIAASVQEGVRLSLQAGVVAVGDIAGSPRTGPTLAPCRTLADSPLRGTSFLEFFGIGPSQERAADVLRELLADVRTAPEEGVRFGLQPHAPYSVGLGLYRAAAALARARGLPLATHLAETRDEGEFVATGTGPARAFLERIGKWSEAILGEIGRGRSPVEHLADVLASARFVAAHVNDASDRDIELLARTGTSVAYCPRASEYFGAAAHFGPHRYRDLLRAGVNVAIGTDSIINLPAEAVSESGLGVLDELRLLRRREGTEPTSLLKMGTINGAHAIGLDTRPFEFMPESPLAGLVAVPVSAASISAGAVLEDVLDGTEAPELLLGGKNSCLAAAIGVLEGSPHTI